MKSNPLISWFTNLYPVWTIGVALFALKWPAALSWFNGPYVIGALAFVMWNMGLTLTLADFRRVNVDGTLNLLRAARAANVARFIHISTINVHGFPPPRDASAESPLRFVGDAYSVSKAEGERAAEEQMPYLKRLLETKQDPVS